jgi:hypothetical protein
MARSSGMRTGGGIKSAVVRHTPAPKVAKPIAKAVSPAGVSQIGGSFGNHATDGKKLTKAVVPMYSGKGYSTPVGPKPSLPVGVGKGYDLHGKSGTQGVHGAVAGTRNAGGRDILRDFGPDSAAARDRQRR